jgi:hypothetical protein
MPSLPSRSIRRIGALCAAVVLPLASCVGERDQLPDTPITAPKAPLETHLRGRVQNLATGVAIGGARVSVDAVSDTSRDDGSYNLQRLRVGASEIMTVRAGYDTARTLLPLLGGDQEFIVRLRKAVP